MNKEGKESGKTVYPEKLVRAVAGEDACERGSGRATPRTLSAANTQGFKMTMERMRFSAAVLGISRIF